MPSLIAFIWPSELIFRLLYFTFYPYMYFPNSSILSFLWKIETTPVVNTRFQVYYFSSQELSYTPIIKCPVTIHQQSISPSICSNFPSLLIPTQLLHSKVCFDHFLWFLFAPDTSEIMWYFSFLFWLILLNITTLTPIQGCQNSKIQSFNGLIVVTQYIYIFIQ